MEILNTDKIDFKLSKEDLVETAMIEMEDHLDDQRAKLNKRINKLNQEVTDLRVAEAEQKETYWLKTAKDKLSVFDSSFKKLGTDGKWSFKHQNAGFVSFAFFSRNDAQIEINISISVPATPEELAGWDKIKTKLDEEVSEVYEETTKLKASLAEVQNKLWELPKQGKRLKAELTRKALRSSEGGKNVLEVLQGKTKAFLALSANND